MKTSELRIGNYINSHYGIVCVEILGDLPYPCDIYTSPNKIQVRRNGGYSGIELTEEWLVRLGFEKDKIKDSKYWYFRIADRFLRISVTEGWNVHIGQAEIPYMELTCSIKNVHELQNLVFALTGDELTFKL